MCATWKLLPITILLSASLSAQMRAQTAPTPSKPQATGVPKLSSTPWEQYAVYWTAEPGWRSELQLRNSLALQDLTVTPALRTADGEETALPAITIKPGDVASLDLYEVLMKNAPKLIGAYGSVVLRYSAPVNRALYAAVMVRMNERPIAFHLDAAFQAPARVNGSREGIWWLKDSATDYLVLTNSSEQTLSGSLILYDAESTALRQSLSLSARETKRISVRSLIQQAGLSGSYGGITIDVPNGAGYLFSTHFLVDEIGGFSALLKMFGRSPDSTFAERSWGGVKEWTTRAPMLALSDPDPALAFPAGTTLEPKVLVRNTSTKTYTAHIRFNWRAAATTGKSAPVDLVLKPSETRALDVAALQRQRVLPGDAHWAAVIISAAVQPDDLIAVATSYDHSGRYGAQTPFNDQLAPQWEVGKWEVDSMHNSLVTVGNGGNKPVHAQVNILYNHGGDQYQIEQMLAPDEQMWLDFAKLIRDGVADKGGHILPPDVTFGAYQILDLTDRAIGDLYEGKVILDKTNGHAAYGCGWCCGYSDVQFSFSPLSVPVSGSSLQKVTATDCNGRTGIDITSSFSDWWTGNTSIATANLNRINGIAVGATNHYSQGELVYGNHRLYGDSCPTHTYSPPRCLYRQLRL